MKHLFLSLVILLSGFHFYAQGTLKDVKDGNMSFGNNPQTMDYFNNLRTMIKERDKAKAVENIKGSPYDNENFMKGTIMFGDRTYNNALLRYNAYADEVEMKINNPENKSEEIYALSKSPNLSFIINNNKIKYTAFLAKNKKDKIPGNVFVLVEGKEYSLYQRKLKRYKESKRATTSLQRSFPARFVDGAEYYMKTAGQTPTPIKLKQKEILAFLTGDKKNKVKTYIKENKIDIKKTDHLVKLVNYMNSL